MIDEVPTVQTFADVIEHYNRWAAERGMRLRLRAGPAANPLEWFDPATGESVG